MIPQQLQRPEFGFVLLAPKGKNPTEKAWQKHPHSFDSPELQKHLAAGGNYGILGGEGNLLILQSASGKSHTL